MRILISAAETSSDAHGAELLKAIRKQLPEGTHLEAFGIGGPKLQSAGLRAVVDARQLLAMGFVEILGHLPKIFGALKDVVLAAEVTRPDVAVVIDYPDFHFRLAKRLKALGIPLVYFIPPKVWVWRKSRIKLLKAYFQKVLCIFPFEESFYKNEKMNAIYVGNPLMDELPLALTKKEAREKLRLSESDPVLVLMPGSRKSELKSHLELMLQSTYLAAKELRTLNYLKAQERLKVLMPFPVTAKLESLQNSVNRFMDSEKQELLEVHVSQGNAHECLVAADFGLIKSGTSTLEAALLKCPHAIVYKPGITSEWIFKYLIRYKGPVGLVNLVAGWKEGEDYLVKEILCEKVTLESLRNELVELVTDSKKRQDQLQGFNDMFIKMVGKSGNPSPSVRAAQEILDIIRTLKKGP